jgi:hypothetical protein
MEEMNGVCRAGNLPVRASVDHGCLPGDEKEHSARSDTGLSGETLDRENTP